MMGTKPKVPFAKTKSSLIAISHLIRTVVIMHCFFPGVFVCIDMYFRCSCDLQVSFITELYRVQFRERKKKASESLPKLGQVLRRLSNLAYSTAPRDVRETLAKEQFIDATP
jgi:hypothetical protein